jgi:hypothetical protein
MIGTKRVQFKVNRFEGQYDHYSSADESSPVWTTTQGGPHYSDSIRSEWSTSLSTLRTDGRACEHEFGARVLWEDE